MPKSSNLHGGHRSRMRARLEKAGYSFDSFEPHEILEMLLYSCYAQKNTNEIAHALINCFGSLEACVTAPVEELCKIKNISIKTAAHIKFYGSLLDKAICDNADMTMNISNPQDVFRFLNLKIGVPKENKLCIIYTLEDCVYFEEINENFSVIKRLSALKPDRFATVRITSVESQKRDELQFADRIQSFACVHTIDYADHYVYSCDDIYSLRDDGLI